MKLRREQSAFSLVEVVLAVGIFAFAVLALLGFFGVLLRDAGSGQEQADTAQLIALTTGWLQNEAARDFERRRDRLVEGGTEFVLYLYAWESPHDEWQWKVGEGTEWRGDLAHARAGEGQFRSLLYRVTLHFDPVLFPGEAAFKQFCPLRAQVASTPVGDPGLDAEAVEAILGRRPVGGTFFAVFRP